MRRTETRADAEDAIQEACVRAWIAFDELRDRARVRAWLYRIVRTVVSETGERSTRRRRLVSITRLEDAHETLLAGDRGAGEGGDVLFDEVAARLSAEEVHAGLAQLPEDFAVAVELHDIDGFKYQEIAEIVGVPIGTVMSRISRGRRLLAGAVLANRSGRAAAQPVAASAATRGPHGGGR